MGINTGGTASLVSNFSIKTLTTSVAFHNAIDGPVAEILIPTHAFPRYYDSSTLSGMSLTRITVGIKEIVEKS